MRAGWGVGSSGYALESAAARVCREAGARVSTNVLIRDMDLLPADHPDTRRLEVVADGLPLHHGSQLVVDTTMVSPLRRNGAPRPRSTTVDGAALVTARARKERRYPELSGQYGRARLCGPRVRSWWPVVRGNTRFLATFGEGQSARGTSSLSNEEQRLRGCCGGASSWLAVQLRRLLCLSLNHGRV